MSHQDQAGSTNWSGSHHDSRPDRWIILGGCFLGSIVEGGRSAQLPGAQEAGIEGEHDSFAGQLLRSQASRAVGPLVCTLYQGPNAPDVAVLYVHEFLQIYTIGQKQVATRGQQPLVTCEFGRYPTV